MLSPILAVAVVAAAPVQMTAPPAPPAPPSRPVYHPPQRELLRWTMGVARCGNVEMPYAVRVPPMVVQSYLNGGIALPPVTMTFRIDATGRPLDIDRRDRGNAPFSEDIAPSLAATRFATGAPRSGCAIVYIPARTPLGQAPIDEVRAFAITPNVRPDREVFRRTFPANTDCFDPGPEVRLRSFPLFKTLPALPGRIGWSMTAFDIDKDGIPVRLSTVDGTHDAALDAASRRAVMASRFGPGARHGCVYPYYQNPAPVEAPPPPRAIAFRTAEATCPLESDWATQPRLIFPAAYNRRKIEGWAIIGFDLAPWGATGNVRVLASQPSSDFGESAVRIVQMAAKAKSTTGYTGCVERVIFRIGQSEDKAEHEAQPIPTD